MSSQSYHCNDFDWSLHASFCSQRLTELKSVQCVNNHEKINRMQPLKDLSDLAHENWDHFHIQNKGKFYKPRNYLKLEFPELAEDSNKSQEQVIFEIGCGYGCSILPILKQRKTNMHAYACDFSREAIRIFTENPLYKEYNCTAFVCDITKESIENIVHNCSVDIVLLIFAMSAIPPSYFELVINKIKKCLKPGGVVCFRDYGLYDLSMMRSHKQLEKNLYYRNDGTLAYYFSIEKLREIFCSSGEFIEVENFYCTVRLKNRRKGFDMDRVWIHAKFQKV